MWAGGAAATTIQDVAEELHLDWDSVKALDKQYMQAQLARGARRGRAVIGIDEISDPQAPHIPHRGQRPGPRRRAIWFGGEDRSEASMDSSTAWLGAGKRGIRLAVMDMWKPFATRPRRPCAAGRHPVRQVPRPEASGRGSWTRCARRIRAAVGQGPAVRQGPTVHAVVALGEPSRRPAGAQDRCSRPTNG